MTSETKVRVEIENVQASGRRKGWTKLVYDVDTSKTNGYAFDGRFLNDGKHDLEVGAVLVSKDPCGSVKNGHDEGMLGIVQADGSIDWTCAAKDWRKDFLDLRDAVAEALNREVEPVNPLAAYTDEQILAELHRRGLTV